MMLFFPTQTCKQERGFPFATFDYHRVSTLNENKWNNYSAFTVSGFWRRFADFLSLPKFDTCLEQMFMVKPNKCNFLYHSGEARVW